jgi:hypothetical protein
MAPGDPLGADFLSFRMPLIDFLACHFSAIFPPTLAVQLPCGYNADAMRKWRNPWSN